MRTVAVAVFALLLLLVPVASGVASETSRSAVVLDRAVSAVSGPSPVLARAQLVSRAGGTSVDDASSIDAAGTSGLETVSGAIGSVFLVGLVVALLVGVAARLGRRFSKSPPHELRSLALRGYLRVDPVKPGRRVRQDWTMVPLRPADDRLTAREAAWYGATFTVGMAPTMWSDVQPPDLPRPPRSDGGWGGSGDGGWFSGGWGFGSDGGSGCDGGGGGGDGGC
jgi:uncharacterized membrane protein YgcG